MVIRVIKKWHEPKIKIEVLSDVKTTTGVAVTMEMDDFLKEFKRRLLIGLQDSLKNSIPKVTFVFRKETFHAMVDKSVQDIINGGMIENIAKNIISVIVAEGEKVAL